MHCSVYSRFISLLLLAITLLTSCSDIEDILSLFASAPEEDPSSSAFVAPTVEAAFADELTTAARILARGEMVVGVRYDLEPFSYITENSEVAGFEIDLARELARRWLGNPDAVRFRQVRSDSAFQHLAQGTVDIVLAGVSHTQEMEARADFSPPYFVNGMALLTFPDTGIQSVADLGNHIVGTVDWTNSLAAVQATAPPSVTYATYEHFYDVVEALRLRQMDVYADQRHRLERARRTVMGTIVVGPFTDAPVTLVYREDDPFFDNLVQLTFQDMAADGTRDQLYAQWLPGTSPPQLTYLPGNVPTPAFTASPQQRSTLDVSARIGARGTLAVGYFPDRWPYSGNRTDGIPTGFEVRLMERIAERWLGDRQAITFVPVTEADGVTRLRQGEFDILLGNWTRNREIALQADYSVSIVDDGVSIFSLAAAPMADLAALNGKAVGVVTGSPGEVALPILSQASGIAVNIARYPDFATAVDAMSQGVISALVTHRRPALDVHFRQAGYYLTDVRYIHRPVVYLVPEGDSDFRDLLNHTLFALQSSGTYQELYGLWFDDAIPTLTFPPGAPAVPLVIERTNAE